jgi:DNA-binding FadR family transcriptional regulator
MFEPLGYAPIGAFRRPSGRESARAGGQPLTETELARQFEVNRSTVREALRKLESNGLLGRRRGGKRLYVTRPTRESVGGGLSQALTLHRARVVDVWEALQAVQPGIAAAAAERRSDAALAHLEAAALRFAGRKAQSELAVIDVAAYFDALGEASGNAVFMLLNEPLLRLLRPRDHHRPRAAGALHRVRTEGNHRGGRRAGCGGGIRLDDAPRAGFPARLRSRRHPVVDRGRRGCRCHRGRRQLSSMATAVASPPPMQSAATPRFLPWRFRA